MSERIDENDFLDLAAETETFGSGLSFYLNALQGTDDDLVAGSFRITDAHVFPCNPENATKNAFLEVRQWHDAYTTSLISGQHRPQVFHLASKLNNPAISFVSGSWHGILAYRAQEATRLLVDSVEINKSKRGGVPVVRGTRFSVAQVLAELAEDHRVSEISSEYEMDLQRLRDILNGLALHLDKPLIPPSNG